jgi:DNA-binding LytR/AlgR family response regulator
LIYYNIQLRRNLKKATEINQNIAVKKRDETKSNRSEKLITIAVNQKNALNISKENLICVEAEDNYVNIHYTNSDRYKKEMIRSTLKKMEEQLSENQQFVRCHKSFIVNLQKLQHVKGNAQGYKLKLEGLDFEIPVSRKLSKTILEKIAS